MPDSPGSGAVQWDFFIAHANKDARIAEQLYDLLAPSARVFLDRPSVQLSKPWDTQIAEAQAASRITVALISSNSADSHFLRVEIQRAILMSRKRNAVHGLLPAFLEDVDV